MKFKLTLALSTFLASAAAQADMMIPAVLNVDCVQNLEEGSTETPMSFSVVSVTNFSAVFINGEVYEASQIIAGTEGGPAYAQAVNNAGGYNITFEGGDFVTAFNDKAKNLAAEFPAYVNLFNENKTYVASCTGFVDFSK